METKILSRNGAGRSRRRRTDLIGSLGKLLFCLLLAGSFLLGPAPAQVARAASHACGCGDTAGLISAISAANATPAADTITLTAGCTYQLTGPHNTVDGANGLPSITSPITIAGNGATIVRATASPTPPLPHLSCQLQRRPDAEQPDGAQRQPAIVEQKRQARSSSPVEPSSTAAAR